MNCLFTAKQMQTAEKYTIETLGIPALVLMERAALAVSEKVMALYPKEDRNNVIVVSGCGNNGADGIAVARILSSYGYSCEIIIIGNPDKMTIESEKQLEIARKIGIPVNIFNPDNTEELIEFLSAKTESGIMIDGLFGIGLNRPLKDNYIEIIHFINNFSMQYNHKVFSVDLPSGLNAATGRVEGAAVKADVTITFETAKTGHILREGPEYCGKLFISKVGIEIHHLFENDSKSENSKHYTENTESIYSAKDIIIKAIEDKDIDFDIRPGRGNKGTFGKVLCITGSANMGGASILSARAALRSGAGMVKVLSLCQALQYDELQTKLLADDPEIMYESISDDIEINLEILERNFNWCDVLLLGCGLSLSPMALEITKYVMLNYKGKLIVDADGLNILSDHMWLLLKRKEQGLKTILTPHPGEFHRLFHQENGYEKGKQLYQDSEFITMVAKKYGIILVAKDAKTLIADGNEVYINTSGNSGMATAGSGDVLAGMLAGFLAPEYSSFTIANAAKIVYLHGKSGDASAETFGEVCMSAGDIIRCLPNVITGFSHS